MYTMHLKRIVDISWQWRISISLNIVLLLFPACAYSIGPTYMLLFKFSRVLKSCKLMNFRHIPTTFLLIIVHNSICVCDDNFLNMLNTILLKFNTFKIEASTDTWTMWSRWIWRSCTWIQFTLWVKWTKYMRSLDGFCIILCKHFGRDWKFCSRSVLINKYWNLHAIHIKLRGLMKILIVQGYMHGWINTCT